MVCLFTCQGEIAVIEKVVSHKDSLTTVVMFFFWSPFRVPCCICLPNVTNLNIHVTFVRTLLC